MAVFRLSTFRNEDVLISESFNEHLPFIRIIMIFICILIGIGTLINLILMYIKYKLILKSDRFHRIIIPLILFLNIIFHVSHYAHNIYDPAGYFEPRKLYQKLLFSEMEQTFFFNFPLSILFIFVTRKLLLACTHQQINSFNMLLILTAVYSVMSMISGGHYTYEPPWNFSWICNITIAGETILALILLIISIFIYQSNSSKSNNYRYTQLAINDEKTKSSNIRMSINPERSLKSKMSDNESM